MHVFWEPVKGRRFLEKWPPNSFYAFVVHFGFTCGTSLDPAPLKLPDDDTHWLPTSTAKFNINNFKSLVQGYQREAKGVHPFGWDEITHHELIINSEALSHRGLQSFRLVRIFINTISRWCVVAGFRLHKVRFLFFFVYRQLIDKIGGFCECFWGDDAGPPLGGRGGFASVRFICRCCQSKCECAIVIGVYCVKCIVGFFTQFYKKGYLIEVNPMKKWWCHTMCTMIKKLLLNLIS